jgi:hypothetical protein
MMPRIVVAALVAAGLPCAVSLAQPPLASPVEIRFDRYYEYDEVVGLLRALEAAHPDFVAIETIGRSLEGRDLIVATITNEARGSIGDKPAMWIDANVHGNEIQGTEIVLYTAQLLLAGYGQVPEITRLLDESAFHLMPSVNPDGRAYWFEEPSTSSSSRAGARPVDSDGDGLFDEDPPNDLDGDGAITTMWKRDPDGDFVRDAADPRVFRRARDEERDRWRRLGLEGVDDDLDGLVNEDGKGGDDLNRNWPRDWQPNHIQYGASNYPLSQPECRAVAEYLAARPNVAAVQSYHNSGGMILRGPGADYFESAYPASDVAVYDELGRVGEMLLPYYRYMVIYRDLYTVHGGFVNWTAESLGIFSFTNELWTESKLFQRDGGRLDGEKEKLSRDWLLLSRAFTDFRPYDHPTHGEVLIGGETQFGSRVTPGFLLAEECHRNAAFTLYHAAEMPRLTLSRQRVRELQGPDAGNASGSLFELTVQFENEKRIPTRARIAQDRGIGSPDRVEVAFEGDARVLAGGALQRFDAETFDAVAHEPSRLLVDEGIPSRGERSFRFLVRAPRGASVDVRYVAEKATDVVTRIRLEPSGE